MLSLRRLRKFVNDIESETNIINQLIFDHDEKINQIIGCRYPRFRCYRM